MEDRNYNGCLHKTPFQKNVENVINYLTIKNLTIIWLQMVDILINYEVRSLTCDFLCKGNREG